MSFVGFELIDIPIEFKEINPSDFDSQYYKVEQKIIIKPNKKGFISDELLPILEKGFDVKNTVVINAGVGQGKSRAILQMVQKYSNNDDYVVIIAVPYKNLITQYVNDCLKFTMRNSIFNQLEVEEEAIQNVFEVSDEDEVNSIFSMSKFNIHVLTTNGLLGNPGEDNLFQSGIKSKYFKELQNFCNNKNKKLIVIFDEIHDSINNFKEELIINLWNYQGLVHKIFTVSATYNEASKEVIKYLSELTEKNIQIIESKRTIITDKQSELFINFYSDRYIEREYSLIVLLEDLIKNKLDFDMMVYSSNLIKKFISKPAKDQKYFEVNNLLYDLNINRCYNDIFDPKSKQKYSPSKINIGTNFSTGINIEKLNHNYIVIFPKEVSIDFFNNKGVFTNGANTIIQALARQRTKGKIYIFLPEPMELNEKSLKYKDEISNKILSNFKSLGIQTDKKINYSNINHQEKILDNVYQNLLSKISTATSKIEETDRAGMNILNYPKKEIFKLYKGEKFLAENFFEGNLSTYILWASMCNQFLNCRLADIHISKKIRLTSAELENDILAIYNTEKGFLNSFYEEFSLFNSLSEFEKYEYLDTYLFNKCEVLIDNKQLSQIFKDKISFILIKLISENTLTVEKGKVYLNYLKSSIYFSNKIDLDIDNQIIISEKNMIRIRLFKEWNDFIELLEIKKWVRKKNTVLSSVMFSEFENLFIEKNMKDILKKLMIEDLFLSNKNFPFYERFKKCKTDKQFAKSFYSLMIEVLYNVTKATPFTDNKKRINLYILNNKSAEAIKLKNFLHQPIPEFIL